MSIYKIKEYNFYNNYNNDVNILCISDLHINKTNLNKIYKIINNINKIKPKYLFIIGDIINSRGIFTDNSMSNIIIDLFKTIKEDIQIYYVYGNHEYYKATKNTKAFETTYNTINKLDNVHFLHNDVIENDDIYISGISLPLDYYENDVPGDEDKDILLKELKSLKKKSKDTKNKPRVLLIHSPICLDDEEIKPYLEEFDTVYTGHMHNGGVPYILDDILKNSTSGFISPYKKLGGKLTRNIYKDKIIINGPISIVKDYHHPINLFFPIHMSIINYKKGDKKLEKKRYYKSM